jgi:hypothetical protein
MGQHLMNPPSVEGWQGGSEWINTGAYVQRVNFASRVLHDPNKPGIRSIVEQIQENAAGGTMSAEALVDTCLQIVGPLEVLDTTREGLIEYASQLIGGDAIRLGEPQAEQTILALLQLVVTTQEYQMVYDDLYTDLKAHDASDDVLIFVFSELGRRVKDNGNGTDHGSGGVSFLIDDHVQGGTIANIRHSRQTNWSRAIWPLTWISARFTPRF